MNFDDESETLDASGPAAPSVDVDRLPCQLGDVLSGRYRLDDELGQGGMGVVYRGWDSELERPVAVKVVRTGIDSVAARRRLLGEARAAAALRHPHVVAVHDVGEHDGVPYLVMELVEGASLRDRPPTDLAGTLALAIQICSGLDHAHRRGLVHRDLKPANVLLEERDGTTDVKIVDLGLAIRTCGDRITREGGITGTVAYMAPEQALGRELDGRADLYALGVMLYELVAGRLPFSGDHPLAVLSQHLHAPVVPPRTYRADLPADLDALIVRLLSKDPANRIATAAEVAEILGTVATSDTSSTSSSVPALGGLARGRMVGRQDELNTLRRAWRQAVEGRGELVLVSGEPGAGKTRLVRELTDLVRITGGTVLSGGCYELEAATPYLPFVEAFRSWVHDSTDEILRAAVGDVGAQIARLAPALASRIGDFVTSPAAHASEERLRLFDGVARTLARLADSRGLLLVIDDLQWADQASLSLLQSLVRSAEAERILIIGCYRETELDRAHPLAETLDDWNRERVGERVHLTRLDEAGTAAMLSALLGDDELNADFCASIHRETDGNPFFVEEVVKTLIDEGQIVCEGGEWRRYEAGARLVLPQGVKAAIGRRLNHLGEVTTEILRTAAVLGKVFDYAELNAVCQRSEDELLDALDEAVAAQLLETRPDETIAFTHDKVREVLYHELNPIRRRRLHGRIAEGLEQLRAGGATVTNEDLAHHSIEGGRLEQGLEHAVTAAVDATAIYAYQDALGLYERACDCAEALGRWAEIPPIDAAMGDVFALKGEPRAAAAQYERALVATADTAEQVRLRCLIADSLVMVGDARALEFAAEARTALDPASQPAEVARVIMTEARFHHYHGCSRQAAAQLHLALDPAQRSGDPNVLGWIYGYLAGAYQHLAEFEESDRWANRTTDLGHSRDDPNIESIGVEFRMENAFMRGRWDETLDHATRHRALGERARSTDRLAWNAVGVTFARTGRGELVAAQSACREGLALAERIGDERLAAFLGAWTALLAAERGHLDDAVSVADYWVERAAAFDLKSGQMESLRIRSLVAERAGEHATALAAAARLDAVLEGTDEAVIPAMSAPTTCQALIALGRVDEAGERLTDQLELTSRAGMDHWHALGLAVRGQLDLARGGREAAILDLDHAITIFERLGSRLELGRALARRARLLPDPSVDLSRAQELFTVCGAAADLAALERP